MNYIFLKSYIYNKNIAKSKNNLIMNHNFKYIKILNKLIFNLVVYIYILFLNNEQFYIKVLQ